MPSFLKSERSYFWILLVLCVLAFMTNLHGYPLFDVDEPRYMETAREFLYPPYDWITPHFNWMTRFDKPILFYWLLASSFKLFGVTEWAGRIVSAIAGTLTVLGVYEFTKIFSSRKQAFLTGLILITTAEFGVVSRWAITDMTLCFFMVFTTMCLFLAIERNRSWAILGGMFCGLGLLTKGPVALALPGGIALLYTLISRREQCSWLWHWKTLLGIVLALFIAFPWYYLVNQANPTEFIQKFFLLHNIERFTGVVSAHAGPWWYYVPIFLCGGLPWTFLLFSKKNYFALKNTLQTKGQTLWQGFRAQPAYIQFAWIFFLLTFIFFSAAGTKLLTYIITVFPATAILFAFYYPKQYRYKTLYSIATGFLILKLLVNFVGFPLAAQIKQGDMLAFSQLAIEQDATLATYDCKRPSLVYYSKSRIYVLVPKNKAADYPPESQDTQFYSQKPVFVVLKTRQETEFLEQYSAERLKKGTMFSLFRLNHPQNVPLRKDINQ